MLNPFGSVIQTLEFVFCVMGQASSDLNSVKDYYGAFSKYSHDIERQILVASGSPFQGEREDRGEREEQGNSVFIGVKICWTLVYYVFQLSSLERRL